MNKVVTTKYLAKFQGPRAITLPKIIAPERNINMICNLSLYTHIPNIKSISQSIAKSLYWISEVWLLNAKVLVQAVSNYMVTLLIRKYFQI
jgi:hypothetical protein